MNRVHKYKLDQKNERRRQIMAVPCPQCGAEAGAKCIGVSGLRKAPHRARSMAASQGAVVVGIRSGPNSEDRANEILAHGANVAADDVRDAFTWGAERCESPIERILLARFVHPHTRQNWDVRMCDVLIPPSGSIEHVQPPPIEGFYLWPQIKIGPHRVDFVFAAVTAGKEISYSIIECDGHDFHEKTKEQAQRDKARDRYLTGRGFRVLRFTGSEIYRDPEAVWDEIIKIALGLCDD